MPKIKLVEGNAENVVGIQDNYIPVGEDGRRALMMPRELTFNNIVYKWIRRDGDVNVYKVD